MLAQYRVEGILDLYVPDFPKSTSKYFFFYILVLFSPKHFFGGVFVNKNTQNM